MPSPTPLDADPSAYQDVTADADAWVRVEARLQRWFDDALPYWRLILPVWADWIAPQIAWYPDAPPALSFPDPYGEAPDAAQAHPSLSGMPLPWGRASLWDDPARGQEPAYDLTSHQHMARLAHMPGVAQGLLDACDPGFAVLARRCSAPVLLRLTIRRSSGHFSWEMSLARWDDGRGRWIDASKPRPDLGLRTTHLRGEARFAEGR